MAGALLLPVWTVLGVATAVAVRCADGSPVLHRQRRLGRAAERPGRRWRWNGRRRRGAARSGVAAK